MAIKTIEELKASIHARIGEDNSDEALALIEDVSDTLADLDTRARGDGEVWKTKYENNDREWRERYRARFNEPAKQVDGDDGKVEVEEDEKLTYEKLFKED